MLINSTYRTSTGVQDSRTATRELKDLVDGGVVEQTGTRGGATYQVMPAARPEDRQALVPVLDPRGLTPNETRILGILNDARLSRAEIERITGLTKAQVVYTLRNLRGKGLIAMDGAPISRTALWAAIR